MAIDKEHLEDKLYDISSMAEDLLYEIKHMSQDDLEFNEPAPNIDVWKDQIIRSLPKGCSVAFRLDVEKALEQFQNVY